MAPMRGPALLFSATPSVEIPSATLLPRAAQTVTTTMEDTTDTGLLRTDMERWRLAIPPELNYAPESMARRNLMYGTAWKGDRTADLVYQAIKAGFRAFATAAQPKHYREDLVGQAISRAISEGIVSRKDLFIQTTFTPLESQDPDNVPYSKDDDPAVQAKTSIEASLDMFRDPVSGEAYLDAAILHAPYPSMTTTTQVLRAMSSFGGPGGRVRQLGISNVTEAELRDVHARGDFLPQIVQNRCRYTNGLDRTARAFCKAHHIVYQAFGVLQNEPLLEDERTVLEVARALAVSREAALYALVMVALGADDHPGNLYEDVKVLNGTADVQHMREDLEQVNRALCALKDAALWEVVRLDRARQDLGLHGKQEERGTHPKEQHAFLGEDRSVVLLDESLGSKLRQAMESFRNGIGEP